MTINRIREASLVKIMADQLSLLVDAHINVRTEDEAWANTKRESSRAWNPKWGVWGIGRYVHFSFEPWTTTPSIYIKPFLCLITNITRSSLYCHSDTQLHYKVLSLSLVRRMGYKVEVDTKMSSATVRGSKRKVSCRKLGGYLREQKGRLYIIRRCVVMLICWHDWTTSHILYLLVINHSFVSNYPTFVQSLIPPVAEPISLPPLLQYLAAD